MSYSTKQAIYYGEARDAPTLRVFMFFWTLNRCRILESVGLKDGCSGVPASLGQSDREPDAVQPCAASGRNFVATGGTVAALLVACLCFGPRFFCRGHDISTFSFVALQVEEGVTMWSFTCWREGEVERDPELRAGRALKELEGWPEEVSIPLESRNFVACVLSLALRSLVRLPEHDREYCVSVCRKLSNLLHCRSACVCAAATKRGPEHAPEQDHRSLRRRQSFAVDHVVQTAGGQLDGRCGALHAADFG